jgi:oligopeptide transport system permease protein
MTDLPSPAEAIKGRSLWRSAMGRLFANKAAVASAIYLAAMALLCVIGPSFTAHPFDARYVDFVKVPPSLEPYPKPESLEPALRDALRLGRLELSSWSAKDGVLSVSATSTRPIDDRVTRYLDRSASFENARILRKAADGLSIEMEASIDAKYFFFGTDANGRDILTRVLAAGQVSLAIGLLAGLVAVVIGVTYGAVSGFIGGKTDDVMMRIVDILYSLPFIFFVIMLVVFYGRDFVLMFIAVGAVMWLDMARIVRGQTLSIKRQEYVLAAEALGVTPAGILWRHVVPNTLGTVFVYMTLLVPQVVILESFLSFLGLGVQEPMTSWGVMISEGAKNIPGVTWLLIVPAFFLVSTLFALNFLGDGLRDALDPKDR